MIHGKAGGANVVECSPSVDQAAVDRWCAASDTASGAAKADQYLPASVWQSPYRSARIAPTEGRYTGDQDNEIPPCGGTSRALHKMPSILVVENILTTANQNGDDDVG